MRAGVDAETGMLLTGWAHCVQSIDKCVRTRLASRVMHRHLGSFVPHLQDENADPETIFQVYVAIAEALNDPDGGEPGFSMQAIQLVRGGRDGRFVFIMDGIYFPLGHVGDFSVRELRSARVGVDVVLS
ncbi:MAG: baseplate assembly protein [Rhizobiaceae bacterium]|nr:baseplate assembly protein [Rhizobiaceae bacterium]